MKSVLPAQSSNGQFPIKTLFYRNLALLEMLGDLCESLLARRSPIRVHVFAESTGQETWSLLFELIRREIADRIELEASDIDAGCVLAARQAVYAPTAIVPVPPDAKERFLSQRGEDFVVRSPVRRLVTHRRLDVRRSAGMPDAVELALFQNVLVHMPEADQKASLANLRRAQAPGGFLSLGGVPIADLRPFLAELGYRPVELRIQEIHDGWEIQRKAWLAKKNLPWALPPFDPERPLDFCTVYRLDAD
jgi:hypothetical protein